MKLTIFLVAVVWFILPSNPPQVLTFASDKAAIEHSKKTGLRPEILVNIPKEYWSGLKPSHCYSGASVYTILNKKALFYVKKTAVAAAIVRQQHLTRTSKSGKVRDKNQ